VTHVIHAGRKGTDEWTAPLQRPNPESIAVLAWKLLSSSSCREEGKGDAWKWFRGLSATTSQSNNGTPRYWFCAHRFKPARHTGAASSDSTGAPSAVAGLTPGAGGVTRSALRASLLGGIAKSTDEKSTAGSIKSWEKV
jgi:hypothetical protein